MPQIVVKGPSTPAYTIPSGALALIPGMEITVLTGAGWIHCHADLNILCQAQTLSFAQIALVVDGIVPAGGTQGYMGKHIGGGYYDQLFAELWLRLGAGQHTLELFGASGAADIAISGVAAELVLHEIGV